jgi:hypothetical protein
MTPEQFIWWLEGFLDGGADIEMDVRSQIREKLEQVGAAPAPKQPAADRPRTHESSITLGGVARGIATPGIATPMPGAGGGFHTGGLIAAAHTVGIVDPHFTPTMCVNSASLASADAGAMVTNAA